MKNTNQEPNARPNASILCEDVIPEEQNPIQGFILFEKKNPTVFFLFFENLLRVMW